MAALGMIKAAFDNCITFRAIRFNYRTLLQGKKMIGVIRSLVYNYRTRTKRAFRGSDRDMFRILYAAYVRPHMECGIQAWSSYCRNDIRPKKNTFASGFHPSLIICCVPEVFRSFICNEILSVFNSIAILYISRFRWIVYIPITSLTQSTFSSAHSKIYV
jgi:hypothetical protein